MSDILERLSTEDLEKLSNDDLESMSDEGLNILSQDESGVRDEAEKAPARLYESPKPSLPSAVLGTTPELLEKQGKWVKSGLLQTAEDYYRELTSPFISGASTFGLGIPKAAAEAQGMKDIMFPEQESILGKAIRIGSEGLGYTIGAGAQLAKQGLRAVAGAGTRLAGKGLLKAATRGAIEGGIMGLVNAPVTGDFLDPEARLKQAVSWAEWGGGIPIAGAGARRIGGFSTGTGSWIAKNIGGVTDATVATIKRLGANRVFDPFKAKADYIATNLMPRIQTKIVDSVKNFTPQIETYARETLGVPESAINTIKRYGTDNVRRIQRAYAGSTDTIHQKIAQGFAGVRDAADKAYGLAVRTMKGDTIKADRFYSTIKTELRRKGWIDFQGNPTSRYKGGLDPIADKMTDLYLDMLTRTGSGKEIIGYGMSKADFSTYRDALGMLLREKPSDIMVMKARAALYNAAENSGMTGIKAARELERKVRVTEKKFLNRNTGNLKAFGEKTLDRFHNLTKDQLRQLKEIEQYTGVTFVDDLDAMTAAKYLDEIGNVDPKTIVSDLVSAKNPNATGLVRTKYSDMLGKDSIANEFDDLMAHFANSDFNIVSDVPGAGGGIYPSRSGMLRSGVANVAKTYYKDVMPHVNRLKNAVSGIGNKFYEEPKEQWSRVGRNVSKAKGETAKRNIAAMMAATLPVAVNTTNSTKTLSEEEKKKFATPETSGDTSGDYMQFEQPTIDDLVRRGKVGKDAAYDEKAKAYSDDLESTFGIPKKDQPLWSWRPSWYRRYKGNIENIPDDLTVKLRMKNGKIQTKKAKDVMRQRKEALERTNSRQL